MIVMKFGGTSVQDAESIDYVAAIVRERLQLEIFPSPKLRPITRQVSGHDFSRAVQPENILGFSPCKKNRFNFTALRLRSLNRPAFLHASVAPWWVFSVQLFALASASAWANMFNPDNNRAPEARKSLAHPEARNAKPEGWVGHKMRSSPVGAAQENSAPRPGANKAASPTPCPPAIQVSGHEFTRAAQPQNIAGFSPCKKNSQGVKANSSIPFTARLKSCPDTCLSHGRQLVVAAQVPMIVIKFPASHSPSRNCPAFLRVSAPPRCQRSSRRVPS